MIKVIIQGAAGRMGRILVSHVLQATDLALVAAIEHDACPLLGQDASLVAGQPACGVSITSDLNVALQNADVIIDFSSPESTRAVASLAAAHSVAHVVGTTGLNDDDRQLLDDLAGRGARIVLAPNMSIGVNLLFALCAKVTPLLGEDYDLEVVEMHHNKKQDAPSGTAVRLLEILAKARDLEMPDDVRHGRVGLIGARGKQEIGMHALRGGDVVGDHTVIFAADGERIELTHKASNRETFAKGALRAAKFLTKVKPGIYDMQDVLNLKSL